MKLKQGHLVIKRFELLFKLSLNRESQLHMSQLSVKNHKSKKINIQQVSKYFILIFCVFTGKVKLVLHITVVNLNNVLQQC